MTLTQVVEVTQHTIRDLQATPTKGLPADQLSTERGVIPNATNRPKGSWEGKHDPVPFEIAYRPTHIAIFSHRTSKKSISHRFSNLQETFRQGETPSFYAEAV